MAEILLITSDYPPRLGGVARYYQGLVDNFPGLQVLTTIKGDKANNVWRWNWWWFGWPHWLPLLWLIPYAKLKSGARYLAAGQVLPIGTALLLTRLAFGWPYLVFVHGFDINLARRNAWKRWLLSRILKHALGVVANSDFTKQLALSAGATLKQTTVVYPCPSLSQPAEAKVAALKERYNLAGRLVVLSVARLVARKGIDDVLSVWPQVQASLPNLTYVIVGGGPERGELEALAKVAGSNVVFVGEVGDEELAAWYQLSDLFVLTPKADKVDVEGFGFVYLEAQAAGRPVIGSRVGGVPEAVGQAGRLVSSQAELVSALTDLLSQADTRRHLGEAGRLRIKQKFNWPNQVSNLKQYIYGAR